MPFSMSTGRSVNYEDLLPDELQSIQEKAKNRIWSLRRNYKTGVQFLVLMPFPMLNASTVSYEHVLQADLGDL